jgi:iron complex outermembrane receptor protein/vitamin B12 transporter
MGFGGFRSIAFTVLILLLATSARAVVVRGRLTDALGKPVANGQVKLMQDGAMAGLAFADANGFYEVRSSQSGRFVLIGLGRGYLPSLGEEFYGGVTDVLQQDVVLATDTVRQQVSVTATGIATPLPQLTAPVSVILGQAFSLDLGVNDELRQTPGAFVVQEGQTGSVTSLFMRGGPSDGNKILIDGIPAEDVGGSFDFGTVSSTGIGGMELYRGPNSALVGSDSQSSVVQITTPRGTSGEPLLTYSGDAGNLHTWRNEVTGSGTLSRFDYLVGYSRLDTSNALQDDRYHSSTTVANVGASLPANTQVRFTLRNGVSAEGVPGSYDFYDLVQNAKEGDQDLYSGVTLENRTKDDWHNLVRYGIARKREQDTPYGTNGILENYPVSGTNLYGNVVTIHGANGYTATDQAVIYPGSAYDQDSNRDELYYQTDYVFPKRIAALFGFRYENERGSFNEAAYDDHEVTQRTNFEYNVALQGDIKNRFFYSLGGAVQKDHLYGIAGEPRIGFAYVPVRPSTKLFHGTKLRFNAATGVQEPSLAEEFFSLYETLLHDGDPQDIATYHIGKIGPERSRTFDVGLDQNILGQKLVLNLGFFHNQFSHQIEYVSSGDLYTYFGINPSNDPLFYGGEINSGAYRAAGLEASLEYQMTKRLFLRGGYTYLDAVQEQSFAGDVTAVLQGFPNENPNIPGVYIGNSSPLIGARPFRRPPHTGYFNVNYTRTKFAMVIKGAMASRSDDSTFLGGDSPNYGNTLLLPNRNLDFGYVKLDLGGTYSGKHGLTYFAQFENLLNDQHIGPIGYPGLPLTFRAGLKLQFGGK